MQLMTDGALTAVDDLASNTVVPDVAEETEDAASLRSDVHFVLIECHRDRGLAVFRDGLNGDAIAALADVVARRLAPRIGGRYVPRRNSSSSREARDAAVWQEFNGRNHRDVMRKFNVSRRLLYSILARRRTTPT